MGMMININKVLLTDLDNFLIEEDVIEKYLLKTMIMPKIIDVVDGEIDSTVTCEYASSIGLKNIGDFEFIKKLISEMYDEKPSFEYETIHDEYERITNEYDKNYFRLKSGNKKINFKNCPEEFGENVLGFVLKRKEI